MTSEFLQGFLTCIIAGSFFALLMAPFINSGRHAAQERIDEDRRRYFPLDRGDR
jgi:gas vesicle protein